MKAGTTSRVIIHLIMLGGMACSLLYAPARGEERLRSAWEQEWEKRSSSCARIYLQRQLQFDSAVSLLAKYSEDTLVSYPHWTAFILERAGSIQRLPLPWRRSEAWAALVEDFIVEVVPRSPYAIKGKTNRLLRLLATAELTGAKKAWLWDLFAVGIQIEGARLYQAHTLGEATRFGGMPISEDEAEKYKRGFVSESYRLGDGTELRFGHHGEVVAFTSSGDIYAGLHPTLSATDVAEYKTRKQSLPAIDIKKFKRQRSELERDSGAAD